MSLRKRGTSVITKDCKGRRIKNGDLIKHGNHKGVVREDEFEGLWCRLDNGFKIRVSDLNNKVTLIKRGVIHA